MVIEARRDSQTLKALLGVRHMVLGGQVSPRERLSEIALAQAVGVSRTPLRAALSRLEQEGLLEPIPSGGYAVRSFTTDDVFDAIELRGVVEGTALRIAAERGAAPARLAQMRRVIEDLDQSFGERPEDVDFDRYVELNDEFHRLLTLLPGSETMRREIERVTQLPFAAPGAFLEQQENRHALRQSLLLAQRQHRDMLNAVEQREGSRAEALGREHARLARRNLEYVLASGRAMMARVPGLQLLAD